MSALSETKTKARNYVAAMIVAARNERILLSTLKGKVVAKAVHAKMREGIYTLEFTDGSSVSFTSSGDDATCTFMSYVAPAKSVDPEDVLPSIY